MADSLKLLLQLIDFEFQLLEGRYLMIWNRAYLIMGGDMLIGYSIRIFILFAATVLLFWRFVKTKQFSNFVQELGLLRSFSLFFLPFTIGA